MPRSINLLFMEHFVCRGTCGGESDIKKVCESEDCNHAGMELESCDCADGTHKPPLD